MYLPQDIWRLIYEFDSTYFFKMKMVLKNLPCLGKKITLLKDSEHHTCSVLIWKHPLIIWEFSHYPEKATHTIFKDSLDNTLKDNTGRTLLKTYLKNLNTKSKK